MIKSKQVIMMVFLFVVMDQSYAGLQSVDFGGIFQNKPDFSGISNLHGNYMRGYEMAQSQRRMRQEQQILDLEIEKMREQLRIMRELRRVKDEMAQLTHGKKE